jgi:hypothetical protein
MITHWTLSDRNAATTERELIMTSVEVYLHQTRVSLVFIIHELRKFHNRLETN